MATHRYWRINITAVNGSTIAGLQEIEMRATSAGADQTGAGTALSSTDFGGAFVKGNAFDNGVAEWASAFGPGFPQWIGYDFGAGVDIVEFTIKSRTTDAVNGPLQAPNRFSLDWSNDLVTWNTVWSPSAQSGWGLGETRTFTDPVAAGSLGATKKVAYTVLGPPLLISVTKKVMYVIDGPGHPRYRGRLIKSAPVGMA